MPRARSARIHCGYDIEILGDRNQQIPTSTTCSGLYLLSVVYSIVLVRLTLRYMEQYLGPYGYALRGPRMRSDYEL